MTRFQLLHPLSLLRKLLLNYNAIIFYTYGKSIFVFSCHNFRKILRDQKKKLLRCTVYQINCLLIYIAFGIPCYGVLKAKNHLRG